MKQLTLLCLLGLVFFASCKKEEDDAPGTIYAAPDPNAVVATPPPPGFQFPKTFKESQRLFEFRIWVKGVDATNKVNPKNVFEYNDWPTPSIELTLFNNHQLGVVGEPEMLEYFYFKNGLYIIDGDTFPFPIAYGNYNQIELYDYQIKLTSDGSSYSRSVFEKATKATLEKEAADYGVTDVDTMAYMNRSLILK